MNWPDPVQKEHPEKRFCLESLGAVPFSQICVLNISKGDVIELTICASFKSFMTQLIPISSRHAVITQLFLWFWWIRPLRPNLGFCVPSLTVWHLLLKAFCVNSMKTLIWSQDQERKPWADSCRLLTTLFIFHCCRQAQTSSYFNIQFSKLWQIANEHTVKEHPTEIPAPEASNVFHTQSSILRLEHECKQRGWTPDLKSSFWSWRIRISLRVSEVAHSCLSYLRHLEREQTLSKYWNSKPLESTTLFILPLFSLRSLRWYLFPRLSLSTHTDITSSGTWLLLALNFSVS